MCIRDSHISNHSAPAFPFLDKGNTCFDFWKHGTGSKLVLFNVFLSVRYSDAAKLLLIYLTVVQTDVYKRQGYDLQNAIRSEFISRGIYKPVATILTQTVIDPYDDAFADPEKIIGRVLTEEEAEAEEEKGNFVTRLADGGYRRIVAAPKPQRIVELETIRALLNADQVVIAAGGGGTPVLEQGINLHGASAIIEKDLAAGLLAEELNADTLLILTSVENVLSLIHIFLYIPPACPLSGQADHNSHVSDKVLFCIPVSYTHLDVYKRQSDRRLQFLCTFPYFAICYCCSSIRGTLILSIL